MVILRGYDHQGVCLAHLGGKVGLLNGGDTITPALEEVIDRIARNFDGFFFGRFDIRVPSREDFMAGRNLKIVELNGVTSEATHIYDPKISLLDAYRVLFKQWRIAFEIGNLNRARGFGTQVAHEVWRRFPGAWEVRVMQSNTSACHFWARAISIFAGKVVPPVCVEGHGECWTLFSFESERVA